MILEFIGLPASGKTTLAKKVYKELNKDGNVIYPLYSLYQKRWFTRNLYKIIFVTFYCLINIKMLFQVISIIAKSRQFRMIDNFRLTFNLLFFLSVREIYKNSDKIVIFDEGIVHHIWAVCVNSKSKESYKLFRKLANKIDVTVKVECPLNLIQERMNSRKNINERHTNFKKDIDRISNMMQNVLNYFDSEGFFMKSILIVNKDAFDLDSNCELIIKECLGMKIEKNN